MFNERQRTFEMYNMFDIDMERLTDFGFPKLSKCSHIPTDLISFNYALSSNSYEKGIHFYIDDYQFERIWNAPHKYMKVLKKYDCVLTPDFSLYTDMPLPMQIWNVYRSRLIGQIMQDYQMKVIPTLQWSWPDTYNFAFDGIEKGGTVSVSTVGVKKSKTAKDIWFDGMHEALKRIEPECVVVYGGDIGFDFGCTKVIYIKNHNTERVKKWEAEARAAQALGICQEIN